MPTLDWIGKKAVINHIREIPILPLEPDPQLSVGPADSGNLLIQGDNLLALKALAPKYAGRIKCIYIDPPYNTGNEGWIYNDNVNSPEIRQWLGQVVGPEGETLDRHDRWLCMMYPRLFLLKDLLSPRGIIAVSIDDNELSNLLALMDEIFKSANRLAIVPALAEPSGGKSKSGLRVGHEYLVVYGNRNESELRLEEKSVAGATFTDAEGEYIKGRELNKWGADSLREDSPTMWFPIRAPNGEEVYPIRNDGKEGRWRWGKNKMAGLIANPDLAHWELRPYDDGIIVNGRKERLFPYEKIRTGVKKTPPKAWLDKIAFNSDATAELESIFGYEIFDDAKLASFIQSLVERLAESTENKEGGARTWLEKISFNSKGTEELKSIFAKKVFDTPKPTSLVQWVINLVADKDAVILDSFAGSGTAGHAVLKQNAADGGKRKFILVETDRKIAEKITAPRLKRVSEGYTDANPKKNSRGERIAGLGRGFQYCRLSAEPLFAPDGNIRADASFRDLAAFVWFMETKSGYAATEDSPLLGIYEGRAIYLLYNADDSPAGGDLLTRETYARLPAFAGPKTIYAAAARGAEWLERENITFKQIPYDLKS